MVYPPLWIELWTTAVVLTLALLEGIALVALGEAFGYLRAAVGLLVLSAALWLGFKYWSGMAAYPPGHVEPDEESGPPGDRRYVCTVCGLELRVEARGTGAPPTHCRERMVLVEDGSPPSPLRPV